ncbi:phospholipase D-like domain-containing protein, partial [Enterobacter cloacae]
RLLREIRNAARRGVHVQLIMQGQPDVLLAKLAARMLYDYLLKDGVVIHEYCQRPLHGKVALVDDEWSTVGSSNLDPLSLALNL